MSVFGDLNKAEVIGNITQDLELRYTAGGTAVMNFSVATNRSYRQNEEWQEEVTFHNIVVWAGDAEQLSKRAKKGTRVFVQGRMQTRSWEDADGKKNYRTEVVSENIILLDRYEKGEIGDSQSEKPNSGAAPKPASKPKSSTVTAKKDDEDIIDPDDLPF
jgi:single-strand DNA-binding protein